MKHIIKIRALVFDDDQVVRELLSSVLLRRGYEVYAFSEPAVCPLVSERQCPCPTRYSCADIIITDLNMPNMTGLELIEKQIDRGCKVRNLAVLSGDWLDHEVKRASQLGCMTFSKPLRVAELNEWLNQCEKGIDRERKLWNWFRKAPDEEGGTR